MVLDSSDSDLPVAFLMNHGRLRPRRLVVRRSSEPAAVSPSPSRRHGGHVLVSNFKLNLKASREPPRYQGPLLPVASGSGRGRQHPLASFRRVPVTGPRSQRLRLESEGMCDLRSPRSSKCRAVLFGRTCCENASADSRILRCAVGHRRRCTCAPYRAFACVQACERACARVRACVSALV